MAQTDVLIAGAGPTGLTLALWLTRQGVAVRIIDKSSGPGEASRAMAVQARTLELYRQLDLAEAVIDAGYKTPAMNLWARGRRRARIPLMDAGASISAYPFVLIYPQDRHERLLEQQLHALGVTVERQTELLCFKDEEGHVTATLKQADGQEVACTAAYLAGCDGAHSLVRHALGSGFEGGTYKQLFYVADVRVTGIEPAGEAHIAFDKSDFVLLLCYGEKDQYRLIGTVRDERAEHPEQLTFADVGHDAINGLKLKITEVNWFSAYRVHHRVTDHFRRGRAFLLGDAAHVHSPAGGQGMNTGILDANNLAWKLAAVIKGKAPDRLLDSYPIERQAFARKLVETTDRLFALVTAQGGFAEFVRTHVAPVIASVAYKRESVREYLFRVVSQTRIDYRDSPLSQGKAGEVQGGDRLPWLPGATADNYASLTAIAWHVHVYGEAKADLAQWCTQQGITLQVFPWQPVYEQAGIARNAIYLLRPDTYVALVDPEGDLAVLSRYVEKQGITLSA
ncbi:FAD-dependent monooxygenase [Pseudomonas sp. CC120222-01a]|uniref:FAD-dependent monooxygenase n=1 Tax=Pseudomonas sp. CC120222-01a TaxID=1378075 RepID=UPI000D95113B|nr:FAD-dependent monooxygenase [Pseudomonas sp. CC120222-01a]PVZ41055.1 2-polyprenyl-6-methoxyphenol hydroxylase-like FAD-dependent oxidoreductase [Pseudomonas sp. CC120222-01a]